MTGSRPALLWFREDLRLADNPALKAAVATGQPLICIYVSDAESGGLRPPGGAARWWLHGALAALDASLKARGGMLHILRGPAAPIIERLTADNDVSAVFWNRRYEAAGRAIDAAIKSALKARGIDAESFNGALLHEPWTVAGKSGTPFRVFTPFWRAACAKGEPAAPLKAPDTLVFHPHPKLAGAVALADLHLEPLKPDWASGLRASWTPSEAGARAALEHFLQQQSCRLCGESRPAGHGFDLAALALPAFRPSVAAAGLAREPGSRGEWRVESKLRRSRKILFGTRLARIFLSSCSFTSRSRDG